MRLDGYMVGMSELGSVQAMAVFILPMPVFMLPMPQAMMLSTAACEDNPDTKDHRRGR